MKFLLFFITVFTVQQSYTQISESFTDGDFTSNPTWTGTDSSFIVNSSGQLQTNASQASTSYLTTQNNLSSLNSKEWRFWIKLNFSPSASNYAKVYLVASNPNLTSNPDGFYLLFGETGSLDAVRLYRQQGGISTEICSGTAGQIAASFAISVKVTKDNSGNWTLCVDPSGGQNFSNSTTGFDNSLISGNYTGILCTYTISDASKFYFDNLYVGAIIADTTPPLVISSSAMNANQIDVLFNESLEISSAQNIQHYSLNPAIMISSAMLDNSNTSLVHLSLNTPLTNGVNYTLSTHSIMDLAGNNSGNQLSNLIYLVAEPILPGEVIINEFMADPTPAVGLPAVEFIEIYNKSNKYFNLQNWKIGDASGFGTIAQTWLYPNQYLILCATSSLTDFPNGIGVTSFPSLNNAGDSIILKDNNGVVIDQLGYIDTWYQDDLKKEGGYTLERMKTRIPCSGAANWKASIASLGGTPGTVNSINDTLPDSDPPFISSIEILSSNSIQVSFNEGMDSASVTNANILTNPTLSLLNRNATTPFPTSVQFEFTENFIGSKEYAITLQSVSDCSMNSGNLIGNFTLPESAEKGDLIINEILYNPLTGGHDFIEIYNTSTKLIDLYNWQLANFDHDTVSNQTTISRHFALEKNNFVVLTGDTLFVKQHYPFSVSGRFIQNDLPTYTNDSSTVYLIYNNAIMDKVAYTKDWQFKLIDDPKGKSLERIDPKGNSNSPQNWHTAAEAIGFATPGAKNSENRESINTGDFDFTSKVISPDNDGFEDILQIHYKMTKPDMIGTFTIYDDRGRLIRTVFQSELLASEGSFTWDGISDNSTRAIIGPYVAVFEAFEIGTGVQFNKTKAFVVAGKL